jgi:hypothetical protein
MSQKSAPDLVVTVVTNVTVVTDVTGKGMPFGDDLERVKKTTAVLCSRDGKIFLRQLDATPPKRADSGDAVQIIVEGFATGGGASDIPLASSGRLFRWRQVRADQVFICAPDILSGAICAICLIFKCLDLLYLRQGNVGV